MKIEFENENKVALEDFNSDYFNSRGAELYRDEEYETAIEYYRIAAAMGNVQSLANLGYCHYYEKMLEEVEEILKRDCFDSYWDEDEDESFLN